jgi:hypothetical protein
VTQNHPTEQVRDREPIGPHEQVTADKKKYSSTLKKEAEMYSEMLVHIYRTVVAVNVWRKHFL